MSSSRTLWEEGRQPGRLVANASGLVALLVVVIDLLLTREITLFFDLTFVVICVAAALSVRPRDFFVIGVFPPLLMAGTVLVLAIFARGSIADPGDGLIQAVVSGLAHHSGALVAGYAVTLGVLAIRRATLQKRRAGARARISRPQPAPVPHQATPAQGLPQAVDRHPIQDDPDGSEPAEWDLPAQADRRRG